MRGLEDIRQRYRAWCRRRLDQHELVYLYLDAFYLKLRPDDTPAEGVSCAWGSCCATSCSGSPWARGGATRTGSRSDVSWWGAGCARRRSAEGAPGHLEGRGRAVAGRRSPAPHGARAAQPARDAAGAPPPEVKARCWKALEEAASAGEAKQAFGCPRRRLPVLPPLGDVGDHRQLRRAGGAPALPALPPQAHQEHKPARALRRRSPPHQGDRPLPGREQERSRMQRSVAAG